VPIRIPLFRLDLEAVAAAKSAGIPSVLELERNGSAT